MQIWFLDELHALYILHMYIFEAGTHYMYNIYSYADYASDGKHIYSNVNQSLK